MQNDRIYNQCKSLGIGTLLVNIQEESEAFTHKLSCSHMPFIISDSLNTKDIRNILEMPNVIGITTDFFIDKDIMKAKQALKNDNINVNVYESKLPFSEFKLN